MTRIKKFVNFLCDLMVIDQPNIYIVDKGGFKDIDGVSTESFELKDSSAATTIVEENKIYIDMNVIDKAMIYTILAHELRHIYQYQSIMHPSWEEPMAETWKEEILNANAFSKLIINVVFKKDFEVNCDQELLKKRIQELMNDFSYEEIKECYEYNIGPVPNIKA